MPSTFAFANVATPRRAAKINIVGIAVGAAATVLEAAGRHLIPLALPAFDPIVIFGIFHVIGHGALSAEVCGAASAGRSDLRKSSSAWATVLCSRLVATLGLPGRADQMSYGVPSQ